MKQHYTFFLYYAHERGGTQEVVQVRKWPVKLRQAHLLVLRKAKDKRRSAFVRLETFCRDDQGILRCYLTDVRCVDKEATSQPDQGTRT